jgi:hypothetical protein
VRSLRGISHNLACTARLMQLGDGKQHGCPTGDPTSFLVQRPLSQGRHALIADQAVLAEPELVVLPRDAML